MTGNPTPTKPVPNSMRIVKAPVVDGKPQLSERQLEALGRELDAIREREMADVGEVDATYIRRLVRIQRALEVGGRASLFLSFIPPFWLAGTVSLGIAKILDNMEIGHNVMHGQYDWMNDPDLHSSNFEWDTASPAEQWKHSHNYRHHTFTNILGKDRDIGYGILRMDESQRWRPYYLGNPVYAFLLATFFEYGVALHDLEVENIASGDKSLEEAKDLGRVIARKSGSQALKDYVLFPALAFPIFPLVLAGNFGANIIRNLWAFTIIFCGHFPDGVATFTEEEVENETRGGWYLRQMLGSANLTGGNLFHIMTGNLSFQIEHHLFPDIPARRYKHIAPEVREICERYGLEYNTGPLWKQFGTVVRKIFRLALPSRKNTSRSREAASPSAAA